METKFLTRALKFEEVKPLRDFRKKFWEQKMYKKNDVAN